MLHWAWRRRCRDAAGGGGPSSGVGGAADELAVAVAGRGRGEDEHGRARTTRRLLYELQLSRAGSRSPVTARGCKKAASLSRPSLLSRTSSDAHWPSVTPKHPPELVLASPRTASLVPSCRVYPVNEQTRSVDALPRWARPPRPACHRSCQLTNSTSTRERKMPGQTSTSLLASARRQGWQHSDQLRCGGKPCACLGDRTHRHSPAWS